MAGLSAAYIKRGVGDDADGTAMVFDDFFEAQDVGVETLNRHGCAVQADAKFDFAIGYVVDALYNHSPAEFKGFLRIAGADRRDVVGEFDTSAQPVEID